jgi:hypothetical protein
MFWRIDDPVRLLPRTQTVPEDQARAHRLPSTWTTVDAVVRGRLLVPDVGSADCQRHDSLALDIDPRTHEPRGYWALRRLGTFVVAIPHFDGSRVERYFPPPAHLGDVVPALGPDAYASLRVHLALPDQETVTALTTAECLACLARFDARSPFDFDADDVARLDEARVVSVGNEARETVVPALAAFLATASLSERALEFVPLDAVPVTTLELAPPHDAEPWLAVGHRGTRWGFRFPALGLAAFPPEDRSR